MAVPAATRLSTALVAFLCTAVGIVPGVLGARNIVNFSNQDVSSQDLALDDECLAEPQAEGQCSVNAVQLRSKQRSAVELEQGTSSLEREGTSSSCHDIQEHEHGPCMNAINWAKNTGFVQHPGWYTGMDLSSSRLIDWQFVAWNVTNPQCPRPCSGTHPVVWCRSAGAAPQLWSPERTQSPLNVSILSYNLFWWNLFDIHGGFSASHLIMSTGKSRRYDVIGLQECEDPDRVFNPLGLNDIYKAFRSSKGTCVAYRTSAWNLLGHGEVEVADDMRTEYYGRRIAQWVRLSHRDTGMKLTFVNHHGPLSVNSGGECGGEATAHNLLKVLAEKGEQGDLLVLVGDFNANAGSRTIQKLWQNMLHVNNGISFGGVDNIFTNAPASTVEKTEVLGSGGSDHRAIHAKLVVGGNDRKLDLLKSSRRQELNLAIKDLEHARGSDGCLIDPGIEYKFHKETWSMDFPYVLDARRCCQLCELQDNCKAYVWTEWAEQKGNQLCTLKGGEVLHQRKAEGYVSGLPKRMAAAKAQQQALRY